MASSKRRSDPVNDLYEEERYQLMTRILYGEWEMAPVQATQSSPQPEPMPRRVELLRKG